MNSEKIREAQDSDTLQDVLATARDMPPEPEALKVRINTLLWEVLPARTTIGQAEEIACSFFQAIQAELDKEPTLPPEIPILEPLTKRCRLPRPVEEDEDE